MRISDTILPEFDHETATTRLLLERVPGEHIEWRPHPKSMSLGQLAMHVAAIQQWTPIALQRTEFDTNPPEGTPYVVPVFESMAALLKTYDEGVAATRAMLLSTTDAEFMVAWTLKRAGQTLFSMPRAVVFRTFIMNHSIHHRGQLSVYLRQCNVALPNIYGPTADTF